MLRHIINDVDDPQTYTDVRLQTALIVGAQFVTNEVNLVNVYTLDFNEITISPDPTVNADPWMINLTVMKTSIVMMTNNLRLAGLSSFIIKDIDMMADTTSAARVSKELLDEIKEMYEHAKMEYMIGVAPQVSAILGAFNILAGGSRAPYYSYSDRDRLIW
jgi:hypothetical protein